MYIIITARYSYVIPPMYFIFNVLFISLLCFALIYFYYFNYFFSDSICVHTLIAVLANQILIVTTNKSTHCDYQSLQHSLSLTIRRKISINYKQHTLINSTDI